MYEKPVPHGKQGCFFPENAVRLLTLLIIGVAGFSFAWQK